MIQPQSKIIVTDNSGALVVGCIRCLKESKKNNATIGEVFITSVKKNLIRNKKRPVLKGHIVKSVLVTAAKSIKRQGISYIKADQNRAILVNNQRLPISSRIFGPVYKDLRDKNLSKVLSLADFIV